MPIQKVSKMVCVDPTVHYDSYLTDDDVSIRLRQCSSPPSPRRLSQSTKERRGTSQALILRRTLSTAWVTTQGPTLRIHKDRGQFDIFHRRMWEIRTVSLQHHTERLPGCRRRRRP